MKIIRLLLVAAVLLSGCRSAFGDTDSSLKDDIDVTIANVNEITREINNNSDFGDYFLGGVIPENSRHIPESVGAMPLEIQDTENENLNLKAYYNHYDNNYRLAMLILYTGVYNLFSIRVGDNVNSVDGILSLYDYSKTAPSFSESGLEYVYYTKNGISTIIFEMKGGSTLISSIQIGIDFPGRVVIDGAY